MAQVRTSHSLCVIFVGIILSVLSATAPAHAATLTYFIDDRSSSLTVYQDGIQVQTCDEAAVGCSVGVILPNGISADGAWFACQCVTWLIDPVTGVFSDAFPFSAVLVPPQNFLQESFIFESNPPGGFLSAGNIPGLCPTNDICIDELGGTQTLYDQINSNGVDRLIITFASDGAAIPEPSALVLLGSGFAGIAWSRRRTIAPGVSAP